MDPRWMALLLGVCLVEVHGSCFLDRLKDAGGPNPHCVGRGGEVFTIGEEKVTDDCFKCSCSYWGLNCCGVGPYNRGSMRLRPGCHVVPGKNCDFSIDCEDE
ncbi:uncharacterized protein LOC121384249 isoform X2 [Gigantopelta aegis]|uniref:uncharacterized protein LOC121384249 isoform X2 n=1 Tax=Gigantopelta aegis TaxID=1735272 RepID=UPI001B88A335|nr:uncharacterized protein LOC121384249 isoform X2 [Gigantopelta aegis]